MFWQISGRSARSACGSQLNPVFSDVGISALIVSENDAGHITSAKQLFGVARNQVFVNVEEIKFYFRL